MKILLPIIVIFVAILTIVPSASAYGGGNGFPPGYYGNPHHTNKLVCTTIKKQLPFGQEISIPSCKVVKEAVAQSKNKNLQQRLTDFLSRIQNGAK
jgi:hypothetical protein